MWSGTGIFVSFAGLMSLAAAAPAYGCEPITLCIDGINDCGVPWGGCYDTCSPQNSPTPPPCTTTHPTTTASDDCSTRTICIDGINECGVGWGTCIPDCSPLVYTTPPCSTGTGTGYPTVTSEPTGGCEPRTLCVDMIDPCGQMYGGCYDTCSPEPSWTRPSCSITAYPTHTDPPTTQTTSCETMCVDNIDACGQMWGGCYDLCGPKPTFTKPSCSITGEPTGTGTDYPGPTSTCLTMCVDMIDACGQWYGGCYDTCGPKPSFTTPYCSITAEPTSTTYTSPPTSTCETMCVDMIDACGQWYGGCYDTCGPKPTFTAPSCSITAEPTCTTYTQPTDVCEPVTLCEDYVDACGQAYGGCYNTCKPKPTWEKPRCTLTDKPTGTSRTYGPTYGCEPVTLCEDLIDPCGQMYGGCYNTCSPKPTWTKPHCAVTEQTTVTTLVTCTTAPPACAPYTICEEWIDLCGQTYGGCYDTCGPKPTWEEPPCTVPTDVCY